MDKKIVGFHVDEVGDWVADLECGHAQHVRHNPPWTNRPWVLETEGRKRSLGTLLDCLKCNMPQVPPSARQIGGSEVLNQQVIAKQYADIHRNDSDMWIRVVVTEGELVYQQVADKTKGYVIDPEFAAVIAPGERFALREKGHVLFQLFYYQNS